MYSFSEIKAILCKKEYWSHFYTIPIKEIVGYCCREKTVNNKGSFMSATPPR